VGLHHFSVFVKLVCSYVFFLFHIEVATLHIHHLEDAMLIHLACMSTFQFVYRKTMMSICRTQNTRGKMCSPQEHDPNKWLGME
jgi:hypothetical protein